MHGTIAFLSSSMLRASKGSVDVALAYYYKKLVPLTRQHCEQKWREHQKRNPTSPGKRRNVREQEGKNTAEDGNVKQLFVGCGKLTVK